MPENKKTLSDFIQGELDKSCHSSAHAMVDSIMRLHGETVAGIIFYGSCLRQDPSDEPPEGILDFYVVVDSLRRAYRSRWSAFMNCLLPPNVFFIERSWQGKTIRAKYAVISRKQWRHGTSANAFHPTLWARFAQPTALLYARDSEAAGEIARGLEEAVKTMLGAILPLIEKPASPGELWQAALLQTYQAELRPEGTERATSIYEADQKRYDAITPLALKTFAELPVEIAGDGRVESHFSAKERRRVRHRWRRRRFWGKPLNVLRLMKSVFTFSGGVDYALWKVERHTGVKVPVSNFERRHPILSSPKLLWRVYRLSAIR